MTMSKVMMVGGACPDTIRIERLRGKVALKGDRKTLSTPEALGGSVRAVSRTLRPYPSSREGAKSAPLV